MAGRSTRCYRPSTTTKQIGAGLLLVEVLQRPSPWYLTPDRAALAGVWFTGWMTAALEQDPSLAGAAAPYARRRLAQLAAANASVTVDHVDLLALPGR